MHTFPFGHYRDEFGKKFLLHATHVVVFNFPSDRRQYTYYLQQVFGIGAKKALTALDFGMYGCFDLELLNTSFPKQQYDWPKRMNHGDI